ncbi:MAG: ISLre2 family transposase [Clostridiales bacterium]|nr:ISLre2 family transposase [Clostridiales bacterium]
MRSNICKLETFGQISANLALKIAENACISSYRNTAKNVTELTGQSISHGGAWNIIQTLGEAIKEEEDRYTKILEADKIIGTKETKVLFEEADGVYVNIQGKDKPEKARKLEMKVAVAYDGWVESSKGRYELRNKVVVAGFDKAKDFQKRKEGVIASEYNTGEIELRILNGDGAAWMDKNGIIDEAVHYQLDQFHLQREIIRKIKDKARRKEIQKLLKKKKIDELLRYLIKIYIAEKEEKEKIKLKGLYDYLCGNKEGLLPYTEKGLNIPDPPEGVIYRSLGTLEHHICDIIAQRMKNRKVSWSIKGGENLVKVLTTKINQNLYGTVTKISKIMLPEKYTNEITEVLSAAKAPKKDGKGYEYPANGKTSFAETFTTNGRAAIRNMTKERGFADIAYI